MEMIDYSDNDDVNSIARKSNVNLKRMGTRFDQKMGSLNTYIAKIKRKLEADIHEVDHKVDVNSENVNGVVDWIRQLIDQLLPVGICVTMNQSLDPNALPVYNDDMSWTRAGSMTVGANTYDIWERTA